MIIRTYQRRNRGDCNSSQESFWSSSQESQWTSSQEAAAGADDDNALNPLPLSQHSSSSHARKRRQGEDSVSHSHSDKLQKALVAFTNGNSKKNSAGKRSDLQKVGLSLGRWGYSAPTTATLIEAQESGEMMEQVDEANFAMDGLRQRRFLRSHGMAKPLLEAVVALPTDDPPLALAAAAVLYLLASDSHDLGLLDTSECIQFLLKLVSRDEEMNLEDDQGMQVASKVTAVFEKMKQRHKSSQDDAYGHDDDGHDDDDDDQLTSRSLALRTLEKACLSAVVLDDSTGAVSKIGGDFKERLREVGGLDAICGVATNCLTSLTGKEGAMDASVGLLLRCLKVMENVTFLSEENQKYLLQMKLQNDDVDAPKSFIELVIKTIRNLQENNLKVRKVKKRSERVNLPEGDSSKSKSSDKDRDSLVSSYGKGRDVNSKATNRKEVILRRALQKVQALNSQKIVSVTSACQKMIEAKVKGKADEMSMRREESDGAAAFSQSPYDFDEVEFEYKKFGESRAVTKKMMKKKKKKKDEEMMKNSISEKSVAAVTVEANRQHPLLAECILSAVKVLMNLTNDNAPGCRQVAACNGLDSLASLLLPHCPLGDENSQQRKEICEQNLDLLVAVLGVLVNLVEKDEHNRGELAVLNVSSSSSSSSSSPSEGRGMIALLCSLFLSKQGAGEAAEEATASATVNEVVDDEDSVKKGQREAEDMIVEAYAALLLAFLSRQSDGARRSIAEKLPGQGLEDLVPVLERFVAFHLSLNMISAETHAAVTDVINSCKQPV